MQQKKHNDLLVCVSLTVKFLTKGSSCGWLHGWLAITKRKVKASEISAFVVVVLYIKAR